MSYDRFFFCKQQKRLITLASKKGESCMKKFGIIEIATIISAIGTIYDAICTIAEFITKLLLDN